MADLRFGTGGTPLSAKDRGIEAGIKRLVELELDHLEVEFVHGVRITQAAAEKAGKLARERGITLTCHGPYYINLNSEEADKRVASVRRILETARAAHWLGAKSITFHPAFMLKNPESEVHAVVRQALESILETLEREGITDVRVSPELTGKESQYGSLKHLLALATELPGIHPCIDFSHYHARTGGAQNSYPEFCATLEAIRTALGRPALEQLHIHVSGINYTAKGERNHLVLKESDLEFEALVKALRDFEVGGWLVCESPNLEEDARLLKDTWLNLPAGK